MRTATRNLLMLFLVFAAGAVGAQQLPVPRDGDIRVVYWDLRNETEVFLTLEPRSAGREKLPVSLTLTASFPGRRPAAPVTQVEVRAHAGALWAPMPQLTMVLDGREPVEFAPPGPSGLYVGAPGEATIVGMAGTISIATLKKMASARSVGGKLLRLEFELDDSQRDAIGKFSEDVLSPDPALKIRKTRMKKDLGRHLQATIHSAPHP